MHSDIDCLLAAITAHT